MWAPSLENGSSLGQEHSAPAAARLSETCAEAAETQNSPDTRRECSDPVSSWIRHVVDNCICLWLWYTRSFWEKWRWCYRLWVLSCQTQYLPVSLITWNSDISYTSWPFYFSPILLSLFVPRTLSFFFLYVNFPLNIILQCICNA